MNAVNPRTLLTLEWHAYQVLLEEAEAYNLKQDEVMQEKGFAAYIDMPHYSTPLEMAAGGVWQRIVQMIGTQKQDATP